MRILFFNIDKVVMAASPDEVITIKDPELEKMIRLAIAKPEGDITALDMEMVYSINIDCKAYPVREIDGLEYAIYLGDFSYRYGITSIDFLKDWENLENLDLSTNAVKDVTPLKDKVHLTDLTLHQNQVEDISVFETLSSLVYLNISYNNISNIAPIMQLPHLEELRAYEELDKKFIDRGMLEALIAKGLTVDYHK